METTPQELKNYERELSLAKTLIKVQLIYDNQCIRQKKRNYAIRNLSYFTLNSKIKQMAEEKIKSIEKDIVGSNYKLIENF